MFEAPELTPSLTPEVLRKIHGELESFRIIHCFFSFVFGGGERLHTPVSDHFLLRLANQKNKVEKIQIQGADNVTFKGLIAIVESWLKADEHFWEDLTLDIKSPDPELQTVLSRYFEDVPSAFPEVEYKMVWNTHKLFQRLKLRVQDQGQKQNSRAVRERWRICRLFIG